MRRALIALLVLVPGLLSGCGDGDRKHGPAPAGVAWLCHPDRTPNPCDVGLRTTVLSADGPSAIETPRRGPARVDCFYVYPTVSLQPADNATLAADGDVERVTHQQAGRMSQHCRVFAPLYRQVTAAGLQRIGTPAGRRAGEIAYADVLAAWDAYRRGPGRGRAVVLFGFSQGAILLRRLIRERIDGDPAVRRSLAGALLIGGNVLVRRGSDRGGDFRRVPLCTRAGQAGCVVAWSSWATDPPADAVFGRQGPFSDPFGAGLPTGAQYEVACTDPSQLAADSSPLRPLIDGDATPFLVTPERYDARCERFGDRHVLRLRPRPGTPLPPSDPQWGTHGSDVAVAAEKLAEIVRRMAASHLQRS